MNETVRQALPALGMGGVMLSIYALSVAFPPGALTLSISSLALLVIAITALARVNDMKIKLSGKRWAFRRLGLVMAAAGAVGVGLLGGTPTWNEAMLHLGVAVTWFTTPNMPPWWRWICGKEIPEHEVEE